MRMRGCAKISSCPEQKMAWEVMQGKEKEEVEVDNNMEGLNNKNNDDDLSNHLVPGWKNLVGVGEATSRQLCRLELANKK